MKNIILLLITLYPLLSFSQANQEDILILNNGKIENGSITQISYVKQRVSMIGKDSKDKFYSFQEISSIVTKEGKNFVTKLHKTESKLLFPILEGDISLLFNEGDSRFYIWQNNLLVSVSKENLKLALNAIFGKNRMEEFSKDNAMGPSYGQKYLGSVVCFMNDKKASACVRKQQLGKLPKGSVYIGASSAIQFSKTWIEYGYWIRNDRVWLMSDRIKTTSVPIGIEIAATVGRNLQFDLNLNYTRTTLPSFYYGNGNLEVIDLRRGDKDKFEKDPLAKDFRFSTISADLSVRYFLTKSGKHRIRPYLFAGPTISILTNYGYTFTILYHENDRVLSYNASYQAASKGMAIGYKAGTGLFCNLHRRLALNIFAGYQAERYPRLRLGPEPVSISNTTPYAPYQFNAITTFAVSRYDQMFRASSAGASLLFKL